MSPLRFRARKTIRLGPVRLHFTQKGIQRMGSARRAMDLECPHRHSQPEHPRSGRGVVGRPARGAEVTAFDRARPRVLVLAALVGAATAVAAARRFVTNQYWRRHNIIWQQGWDDAMEIRDAHLDAYEADPERYVAEHGLSFVRGGAAR